MNPFVLVLVQILQALGILGMIQAFIAAILGLIFLFAALRYFRGH